MEILAWLVPTGVVAVLAIVILGERPSGVALIGAGIAVAGVALVSTDLRKLRDGIKNDLPGLPWSMAAAVGFGIAGFLLGLPAIALAGLKELVVLWHAHIPAEAWSLLLVGLLVASLSAFAAIWGLMRFLERFSTWPFIIYRALLGIFLLVGVHQGLFA